jgi:RHS repeat-associated protein
MKTAAATMSDTTSYVYDGWDVVAEKTSTGTSYYIRTPFLDEPLARVDGSNWYYYHADDQGSTLMLTNESGDMVTRYAYSPFGITTMTGTETGNPFMYTGREQDESGLYYYRYRYYSPHMGRFISEDPIGFAGGDVNFYAYVGNSPLNYTDPLGLEGGVGDIIGLPDPDPYAAQRQIANLSAGFGDALLFLLPMQTIRNWLDIDSVDTGSGAYRGGKALGYACQAVAPAGFLRVKAGFHPDPHTFRFLGRKLGRWQHYQLTVWVDRLKMSHIPIRIPWPWR